MYNYAALEVTCFCRSSVVSMLGYLMKKSKKVVVNSGFCDDINSGIIIKELAKVKYRER